GTILVLRTGVGDRVGPLATDAMFEVADLRQMEVAVAVAERDLALVFSGQPCLIQPDAFPKLTYKGQVTALAPIADRTRGSVTVRVRLVVPAGDDKLRPELSALVEFQAKN